MPTDFLPTSGQVSGASVSRDSLGFAYIDLGVNLNPMKAGITAALGYLQYYMVKAQSEMDTAMRNIWTLVDTSYAEIMRYEDKVFQLSQMVPRSAKELAEGLYWIISATIPAAEAMDVLEASAKSATAGLSTTNAAADVLTDIINAYGYSAKESTHISDILFRTVERGKVTYDGLAGSLGAVVGSAALGGVAFEELAAAIATMTQIGLSADESTTALNRFILTIVKSSGQAQAEAKKLGLEWDATALKTYGLVGMIQKLDEATGGNIEKMAKIVPEIRAFKSVLALARDGAADFTKEVENMYNSQGALERAFQKQKDSVANNLKSMQNAFFEFATRMGEALTPAVNAVASFGKDLFGWLSKLPPETNKVIAATLLLSTGYIALEGAIKKVTASMATFNIAAMGPAGWIAVIGMIAAAIVTLVAKQKDWEDQALNTLNKNNELAKSLLAISEESGNAADELGELIKKYEALKPMAGDSEEAASKLNDTIGKIGKIVPDAIIQWDRWGNAIDINIDKAKDGFTEMLKLEVKYAEAASQIAKEQLALIKDKNAKADAELKALNEKWNKYEAALQVRSRYEADEYAQEYQQIGKDILYGDLKGKTLLDAVAKYMGDKNIAMQALKEIYGDQASEMAALTASGNAFINFIMKAMKATEDYGADAERRLELFAVKKEFVELEYQFKKTDAAANGYRKTLDSLGKNIENSVDAPVTAAIDKLDELKKAIDAIFEPFTYKDKTLSGLYWAKKQLDELLAQYPSAEADLRGVYHEQRLELKKALKSVNDDIEAELNKIKGSEIISAKDFAEYKSDADKKIAEVEKWNARWLETMADGLLPEYGDKLITRADADAYMDKLYASNRAASTMAEIVGSDMLLFNERAAKDNLDSIEKARDYWVKVMGDGLLPEYGDKLLTRKDVDAFMEKIYESNRAAAMLPEIVGAEIFAFNKEVKALDERGIKDAYEYWLRTMADGLLPEYGDKLMTKADVDAFMNKVYASNQALELLSEVVPKEILDFNAAFKKEVDIKEATDKHNRWLQWVEYVGDVIPEYGDKLMTREDVDAYMRRIYESNMANAKMAEIVGADIFDFNKKVADNAKKAIEDAHDYWVKTMGESLLPEYGDRLITKEYVDAYMKAIYEANRANAKVPEIVGAEIFDFNKKVADEAQEAIRDAHDYWVKTMGDALLPEYGDKLMTREYVDAYMKAIYEANRRAATMPEIISAGDFSAYADLAEDLKKERIKRMEEAVDSFLGLVDGLISVLEKAYDGGYDNPQDALKDIGSYFSDFSRSYWKSVFATARIRNTSLSEAIAMVGQELASKVKDTGDMLIEALSDIGGKLKEVGGSLGDIGDKLIKAGNSLGSVFGEIGGLIGDPIVQLFFSVAGFLFKAAQWLNEQAYKITGKRFYFDRELGTMVYETREGRWAWDPKTRSWKQISKKDEEKRAAFQISEISGPMRDTIVAALAPLNTLSSLPTYTNQIVSAIYEVRDLLSNAFTSGSLAAGAIQQTFNIQSVNIFAYDEATFSSILADLDKQAQLAALGVGG